jgi:hypothetical protein
MNSFFAFMAGFCYQVRGGNHGTVRFEPGFPRWIGVLPVPRTHFRWKINPLQ